MPVHVAGGAAHSGGLAIHTVMVPLLNGAGTTVPALGISSVRPRPRP